MVRLANRFVADYIDPPRPHLFSVNQEDKRLKMQTCHLQVLQVLLSKLNCDYLFCSWEISARS